VSIANTATTTATTASTNAATAVTTANTALSASNAATATANAASSSASSAVSTSNAAALSASTAVSTANSAQNSASIAVATSNAASSASAAAVSSADSAVVSATNAVTVANGAVVTANSADSKADQAIAAVSSSINYTLVPNVSAIPVAPANNTYIEVSDSAGIESFTPLVGLPTGFIGDSGLTVRITYTTAGATWNWLNYFANNAESRYLKQTGGTLTGNLEIGAAASLVFEGASSNGFETTVSAIDPTADRSLFLPNVSGTVVTTGDVGSITSTMLADGAITDSDIGTYAAIQHSKLQGIAPGSVLIGNVAGVPTATPLSGDVVVDSDGETAISSGVITDANLSASAAIAHHKLASITAGSILIGNSNNVPTEVPVTGDVTINSSGVTEISTGSITNTDISQSAGIAVSKLADGSPRQLLQTDATGTGVEWTSNLDVPGTLDVTGAATFDNNLTVAGNLTVTGNISPVDIVGSILTLAVNVAPLGYLKANGAAISRTTYSALFAVIGTTFGAGNGSTTFNLPDLRGEFIRGWDDSRGIDNSRAFASVQASTNLSHNHGVSDPGHAHGVADPGHAHGVWDPGHAHGYVRSNSLNTSVNGTGSTSVNRNEYGAATNASGTGIGIYGSGTGIGIYGNGTGVTVNASGDNEARPRNIALLYVIKY
jgi:microcystin-dependent protein